MPLIPTCPVLSRTVVLPANPDASPTLTFRFVAKAPGGVLDYYLDVRNLLVEANDTIASFTVTTNDASLTLTKLAYTPGAVAGIMACSCGQWSDDAGLGWDATSAVGVMISGGTIGSDALVRWDVTTSAGRVIEADCYLLTTPLGGESTVPLVSAGATGPQGLQGSQGVAGRDATATLPVGLPGQVLVTSDLGAAIWVDPGTAEPTIDAGWY